MIKFSLKGNKMYQFLLMKVRYRNIGFIFINKTRFHSSRITTLYVKQIFKYKNTDIINVLIYLYHIDECLLIKIDLCTIRSSSPELKLNKLCSDIN